MRPFYRTRLGQAFLGDALDVLRKLQSGSVNLIVTSPPFPLTFQKKKPYGTVRIDDYIAWFLPIADQCKRVLNIKFHGSIFREGAALRGASTRRLLRSRHLQDQQRTPAPGERATPVYFPRLERPDLSAAEVGRLVPDDYVWALAALGGKMAVEEAIVSRLLRSDYLSQFRPIFDRMPEGQFRVISAMKASRLMRDKLFERVHALSLKGFTRKFRNAEVDMHFSLSQELTPVRTFLELLVKESPQKFAVRLYTGDY